MMSIFCNGWVYLDNGQAKRLTRHLPGVFEPAHGTGALVHEDEFCNLSLLTLNETKAYVETLYDASSGTVERSILTRDKALNRVSEDMLDRLDPYKQRIEFPCSEGRLVARFFGQPGMYDGIGVDFFRDDGLATQCVLVETITDPMDVKRAKMLHALVWDGNEEDPVHDQVIDKHGEQVY